MATVRAPRVPGRPHVQEHRLDGLHVRSWTLPGPAGRPHLVLVHGLGTSSATFERLAAQLARHTTVHLLDLPGFARLPRPAGSLEVAELAEVVLAWVRCAGLDRPVLVGHSMGAQVVVEAAVRGPGRVAGLVLVGPTTDPQARSLPHQLVRLLRSARYESWSARAVVARGYVECGPRWFAREARATVRHRIAERVRSVEVPVLVVRGEHDRVAPPGWAADLVAAAPHGSSATLPGAGHAVAYDEPRAVADLVLTHLARSERA